MFLEKYKCDNFCLCGYIYMSCFDKSVCDTTIKRLAMAEGKPFMLIFSFVIPVLLGNVFQQFYSVVDSVIVGQLLGV